MENIVKNTYSVNPSLIAGTSRLMPNKNNQEP